MSFTNDYQYYRVGGRSLDATAKCYRDLESARGAAAALTAEVGATGVAHKNGRISGFLFAPDNVPEAWVSAGPSSGGEKLWAPGKRRKSHKELRDRMAKVDIYQPLRDLTEAITGRSSVMEFTGMTISTRWVHLLTFGETTIIGVPILREGEQFAAPADCVPLSMSECWSIKEQHDAAKAA